MSLRAHGGVQRYHLSRGEHLGGTAGNGRVKEGGVITYQKTSVQPVAKTVAKYL